MTKRLSPAEKLAVTKPQRRTPSCSVKTKSPPVWTCKMRRVRETLRLSLKDVAAGVGMTVSGIWQIEHGGDPLLTTARKLADFFGVDVWELWPELMEK
jgi:DNA-binding XRE family transcriptional regulator